MGDEKQALELVFKAIEKADIPISLFHLHIVQEILIYLKKQKDLLIWVVQLTLHVMVMVKL